MAAESPGFCNCLAILKAFVKIAIGSSPLARWRCRHCRGCVRQKRSASGLLIVWQAPKLEVRLEKSFLVLTQRLIRLGQVRQSLALLLGLCRLFVQAGGLAPVQDCLFKGSLLKGFPTFRQSAPLVRSSQRRMQNPRRPERGKARDSRERGTGGQLSREGDGKVKK